MSGYNLSEGKYEQRALSEDEMCSAFSHLFLPGSKNATSYKFGFLKAIIDNLYNVDKNLQLTFDQLFGTFTEIYWNLVLSYPDCNLSKKDKLATIIYLEKLLDRNKKIFCSMKNTKNLFDAFHTPC